MCIKIQLPANDTSKLARISSSVKLLRTLGGVETKKSVRKTATSRASSASSAPREEEEERPRKSRLSALGGFRLSLLSLLSGKRKTVLSAVPEDAEAEASEAEESRCRPEKTHDDHNGAHPFAPIHPEMQISGPDRQISGPDRQISGVSSQADIWR
eukprot:s616_g20.t1